jgi:CubicO group peptidase (beta-lactamase class C family)
MVDTGFYAPEDKLDRLAALYAMAPGLDGPIRYDALGDVARKRRRFLSGGGGLVSTVADYTRFTWMLLRGGELDGVRILGPRTLRYMTRNHLPGNADLQAFGRPVYAEVRYDGVGFGLGFAVMMNAAANKVIASEGEFSWGGLASTSFWVDSVEDVSVVWMTQVMPSSTYSIRPQLRQLVYQSLVD